MENASRSSMGPPQAGGRARDYTLQLVKATAEVGVRMAETHNTPGDVRIDGTRLMSRLDALAEIGAIDGGGSSRLALTDEDRAGRDLVVTWMTDLGLDLRIDTIGNVIGQ